MKTYLLQGRLIAQTSISHIGETYGINAQLRREKVVQTDGTVEEVPIISGNSLRGILRDRGMLHMCRQLGYGLPDDPSEMKDDDVKQTGMSLAAFYFLFSGGALESSGKRGLDIDEARRWRELIPLVSVFGGAMGNQIMQGKLKVGKAIPICQETRSIMADIIQDEKNLPSVWDMVQEEAYVRTDDEKNENLRQLIAPNVRLLLDAEAREKRRKSGTSDDIAGPTGRSQQMRYFVETLAAGTQLFWELSIDDASPIEFDALIVTLATFGQMPYIGGKSSVGHGKVKLEFDNWRELNPVIKRNGKEIDTPIGTHYMRHLQDNGEQIKELINGLS